MNVGASDSFSCAVKTALWNFDFDVLDDDFDGEEDDVPERLLRALDP